MIPNATQPFYVEPAEWLGAGHPLVDQLGTARGLMPAAFPERLGAGNAAADARAVREFLCDYHARLLLPVELPAIRRAFGHASRNQLRELIRFDRQLADEPRLRDFAEPSRRVGCIQLRRMRPMRDVRFVQRYLYAVERHDAHAWHTLVYGLTLSVFSLPLHQGLLSYARQVTRGFIEAAAPALRLSQRECRDVVEDSCAGLAQCVAALVATG